MLAAVVNGSKVRDVQHAIALEDRGLAYGDGVFETMLLRQGQVRFVEDHLARLEFGCKRLGISAPSIDALKNDLQLIAGAQNDGVIKLIVTRGAGGRGYRASADLAPTRIAILYASIEPDAEDGIEVRWCATRLARNATLAGIKHLNRLEYVLAHNEWNDPKIAEGLLLDTENEVIEATTSNLFAVIDGVLTTPDLRFCGVRGVIRARILSLADRSNIESREGVIHQDEVLRASELFVTNAIRGIRPIRKLDRYQWRCGPTTKRLIDALAAER